MDQEGHIIDQKGLKMYEKKQEMEVLDLKYLFSRIFLSGIFLSGIFLSRIGVYPPPLLTENHLA